MLALLTGNCNRPEQLQVEGEKIIAEKYPNRTNVYPDNYYSEQDAEKAITVGEAVLDANPDIDVIICNDSRALPGQLQAAENKGYNKDNITITGSQHQTL